METTEKTKSQEPHPRGLIRSHALDQDRYLVSHQEHKVDLTSGLRLKAVTRTGTF